MNYILGGGLTGLIVGTYLKNFSIITKDLGGQFSNGFQLGPRILKWDEYIDKFIRRNLITTTSRIFKVGYFYGGFIHKECDEIHRKEYFKKTRGYRCQFKNSSMNDGKNSFLGYEIDMEMISMLIMQVKNNIIEGEIEFIDIENKTIQLKNKKDIKYDNLISTIPFEVLSKLCCLGIEEKIEYEPVSFYSSSKNCFDTKDFDFIYFPEEYIPYHRMTILKDSAIYEVRNDRREDFNMYSKHNWDDHFTFMRGILTTKDLDIKSFNDIMCIGRYAQVSHKMRANSVIKFCEETFR